MNREEYLLKLSKYLEKLEKKDFEDTMNYFEEYFDEVGVEGEQNLIDELGEPEDVAREIFSKLSDNTFDEQFENHSEDYSEERREANYAKKSKKGFFSNRTTLEKVLLAILLVILSPAIFTVGIVAISLLFSLFVVLISLAFTLIVLTVVGIIVAVKLLLVGGVTIFTSSFSGGLLLLGSSLAVISISIIIGVLSIYLFRGIKKSLKNTKSYINKKRGDN